MRGVIYVRRLYKDPWHLDFTNPYFGERANRLLKSFAPLLQKYEIRIRPTGYRVDLQKQVEDILSFVPRTSKTRIERSGEKIVIYNIDNRGIKGLAKRFVLRLGHGK